MSEPDVSANTSLVSHYADCDAADFTDLLRKANQSFEDWLRNLRARSNQPAESAPPKNAEHPPKEPCEIIFEGTSAVDGYMTGLVCSDAGTLRVGEGCQIEGDISVRVAIIHGAVRGNICASRKVVLGRGGRVVGDIETPELSMESNAVFEGRCALPLSGVNEHAELASAIAN